MMRLFTYISLFISLTLVSCDKEGQTVIHEELQPYYDSFLAEASLRGIELSADDLNISLDLRSLDGAVGQCQHFSESPDVAIVDLATWENSDAFKKEFLVFHELGHCILGRSHDDNQDENGACLSIMHSDNTVCDFSYFESTRSFYLDELFNI